jgi:phosphopantothenoylcysteine synthetase/decarboxylase
MAAAGGGRLLAVIVCGAGPAAEVSTLITLAQQRGWTLQVIATPPALEFFDQDSVARQTGNPVKSQYSKPGAARSQIPDAVVVAPATYNTINKWAQGIGDTYALGVLAEITGLGVPAVVLPFVNSALAGRAPFRRSVDSLRGEGVRILLGSDGIEPHASRAGDRMTGTFPWHLALGEAERLVAARPAAAAAGDDVDATTAS